jgi:hypothetical protein
MIEGNEVRAIERRREISGLLRAMKALAKASE